MRHVIGGPDHANFGLDHVILLPDEIILGLDPTTVTHPNRAKGLRVRCSVQLGIPRLLFRPRPPVGRARGRQGHWRPSGSWVDAGKQGLQHGGNKRGPRSTRSRKQSRPARSATILVFSVNSVVLACFLRVKNPYFLPSGCLPRRSAHVVGLDPRIGGCTHNVNSTRLPRGERCPDHARPHIVHRDLNDRPRP
jgi:hypothetical protein